MSAIGVLGGTFDPVHCGHLEIAERVRQALRLARMLLLPAAAPPHKQRRAPSPAHHRLAMLRLAIADRTRLEVCTLELERGGVSYTIDTLRQLASGPPSCTPWFVLGTDALLQIHEWREFGNLIREFDLVAVDRAGRDLEQIRELLHPRPAAALRAFAAEDRGDHARNEAERGSGRILYFRLDPIPISSTQVRARVAAGADLQGLVPSSVAGYIRAAGLYRSEDPR